VKLSDARLVHVLAMPQRLQHDLQGQKEAKEGEHSQLWPVVGLQIEFCDLARLVEQHILGCAYCLGY
jgi:hypothetical protein